MRLGLAEAEERNDERFEKLASKEDVALLPTKQDFENLVRKSDLCGFATKGDVGNLVTMGDIENHVTKADITHLATKDDVANLLAAKDDTHNARNDRISERQLREVIHSLLGEHLKTHATTAGVERLRWTVLNHNGMVINLPAKMKANLFT
ncbi:hypothetical protein P154DRAFT_577803 [Amniculicola lignicola CBS 123094]|uniref:Uncharacterized protein n=1 Tax=Amniculicola lignicola CBS 123094 TaxID=1392246 RepID=A0A6A5WM30_9PLEO|nr:hypothetical protein P154DRAFT_577803 [Amniculicola lignicola CBS 123094]